MAAGLSKRRYRLKRLSYGYSLFISHSERTILFISNTLSVITSVASACCLVILTVYLGYNLRASDIKIIWTLLHTAQVIFGVSILFDFIFRFKTTVRHSRIIRWIVDLALLVSLLVWAYPNPAKPWLPWLRDIVYSHRFLLSVIGAYSLVNICYALSRIPNRRTNPSIIMGSSFLFFIIIGSFALMLPRCTYHGISYFDSLFVASSAVCITGLSSVDIPSTFTPFGILVLSVLVQLGSLGVITFTSFFAMFFTGNTSIYNQLLLRDMIYSKSMNSLIPTLLYVLGFTLTVEIVGAVCVYFATPDSLGLDTGGRLTFAAFHSMSSFCNAGFSTVPMGMSNPAFMHSDQNIYIVTSVLIFAGAIGFPILVNFKEILRFYLRKAWNRVRGIRNTQMLKHVFDLNTKLVLHTTLIILGVCSVGFFALEYNNTLRDMSLYDKCVQSVFNSLVPRSAGFASVNPTAFLDVTILLVLAQMFIGGSSQSMAGGIKVNAFAAIILNLKSVLVGHQGTSAFNRTINPLSIQRAHAIATIAALSLFAYATTMLILEPDLPAKAVIFETVSALFTVGSSLGITDALGNASKAVLCTAMFFGRVGMLSILAGLMARKRDVSTHLPVDNIIIN